MAGTVVGFCVHASRCASAPCGMTQYVLPFASVTCFRPSVGTSDASFSRGSVPSATQPASASPSFGTRTTCGVPARSMSRGVGRGQSASSQVGAPAASGGTSSPSFCGPRYARDGREVHVEREERRDGDALLALRELLGVDQGLGVTREQVAHQDEARVPLGERRIPGGEPRGDDGAGSDREHVAPAARVLHVDALVPSEVAADRVRRPGRRRRRPERVDVRRGIRRTGGVRPGLRGRAQRRPDGVGVEPLDGEEAPVHDPRAARRELPLEHLLEGHGQDERARPPRREAPVDELDVAGALVMQLGAVGGDLDVRPEDHVDVVRVVDVLLALVPGVDARLRIAARGAHVEEVVPGQHRLADDLLRGARLVDAHPTEMLGARRRMVRVDVVDPDFLEEVDDARLVRAEADRVRAADVDAGVAREVLRLGDSLAAAEDDGARPHLLHDVRVAPERGERAADHPLHGRGAEAGPLPAPLAVLVVPAPRVGRDGVLAGRFPVHWRVSPRRRSGGGGRRARSTVPSRGAPRCGPRTRRRSRRSAGGAACPARSGPTSACTGPPRGS